MPAIRRLIWDNWNVAHIARHAVTPDEVEEVCHGRPVTSATYKGRIRVIGPTQSRRMLAVILAPTTRSGVYYPVTARPADRRERRGYTQYMQGEYP
jgi:uncharacterized DUF497 family protein